MLKWFGYEIRFSKFKRIFFKSRKILIKFKKVAFEFDYGVQYAWMITIFTVTLSFRLILFLMLYIFSNNKRLTILLFTA